MGIRKPHPNQSVESAAVAVHRTDSSIDDIKKELRRRLGAIGYGMASIGDTNHLLKLCEAEGKSYDFKRAALSLLNEFVEGKIILSDEHASDLVAIARNSFIKTDWGPDLSNTTTITISKEDKEEAFRLMRILAASEKDVVATLARASLIELGESSANFWLNLYENSQVRTEVVSTVFIGLLSIDMNMAFSFLKDRLADGSAVACPKTYHRMEPDEFEEASAEVRLTSEQRSILENARKLNAIGGSELYHIAEVQERDRQL